MATLLVDDSGESKFAKITALFSNQDIKFVSSPDDLTGFDASDYQSGPVLVAGGAVIKNTIDITKKLVNDAGEAYLYLLGGSDDEKKQVDSLLTYISTDLTKALAADKKSGLAAIHKFNKLLAPLTYLASNHITLADLYSFSLFTTQITSWNDREKSLLVNICRWYDLIQHNPSIKGKIDDSLKIEFVRDLPKIEKKKPQTGGGAKKAGSKKKN